MEAAGIDERAERREFPPELGQQLAERVGVEFDLGDAGPLAGNAQKFNTHDAISCYHAAPVVLLSRPPRRASALFVGGVELRSSMCLGVAGAERSITIPASATMWGLTIPRRP